MAPFNSCVKLPEGRPYLSSLAWHTSNQSLNPPIFLAPDIAPSAATQRRRQGFPSQKQPDQFAIEMHRPTPISIIHIMQNRIFGASKTKDLAQVMWIYDPPVSIPVAWRHQRRRWTGKPPTKPRFYWRQRYHQSPCKSMRPMSTIFSAGFICPSVRETNGGVADATDSGPGHITNFNWNPRLRSTLSNGMCLYLPYFYIHVHAAEIGCLTLSDQDKMAIVKTHAKTHSGNLT